jgi:hypothetical protein
MYRFAVISIAVAGALCAPILAVAQTGSSGSTSAPPSSATFPAEAPDALTPPRPAPGSEGSTGSTTLPRAGGTSGLGGIAGRSGTPSSIEPNPRQAELDRMSKRINQTIMRGICTGC